MKANHKKFEQEFQLPDGVVFNGVYYTNDKERQIPGSIALAEEYNCYWIGWSAAMEQAPKMVVERLTGYLWDEEEAAKISEYLKND